MQADILALSGVLTAGSKIAAAVRSAARAAGGDRAPIIDFAETVDLFRCARHRVHLGAEARSILRSIERAEALVVGLPFERGTIPGLFKHVLDLADPEALAGKPALFVADRHDFEGDPMVRIQAQILADSFGLELVDDVVLVGRHEISRGGAMEVQLAAAIRRGVAGLVDAALHARPASEQTMPPLRLLRPPK